MEEELTAVGQAMAGLGDAVMAVLSERGSAREMSTLQQAIELVQDKRYDPRLFPSTVSMYMLFHVTRGAITVPLYLGVEGTLSGGLLQSV